LGRRYIDPVCSGKTVHDNTAAPGGGTVSRGATNIFGLTAGLCGLPTQQGIGPDQLKRTEGYSRPRHTGVDKAARHWRLRPTDYLVCSFLLKVSSFTTVTVHRAFHGGAVYSPRRIGDGRGRQRSRPRGRKSGPLCNEHSRTDSVVLRPSYTRRNRAGSTKTHRARKVTRTAREATTTTHRRK
jgi:hypothetical protein